MTRLTAVSNATITTTDQIFEALAAAASQTGRHSTRSLVVAHNKKIGRTGTRIEVVSRTS